MILLSKMIQHPQMLSYDSFTALRNAMPVTVKPVIEFKERYLPSDLIDEESLAGTFTIYSRNVFMDSLGDRVLELIVDHLKFANQYHGFPSNRDTIEAFKTNDRLKQIAIKMSLTDWIFQIDRRGYIKRSKKGLADVFEAIIGVIFLKLGYQRALHFFISSDKLFYKNPKTIRYSVDDYFASKKNDKASINYNQVLKLLLRSVEEKPLFFQRNDGTVDYWDADKISKYFILKIEPVIIRKVNGYASQIEKVYRFGFQYVWEKLYARRQDVVHILKNYRGEPLIASDRVNELMNDTLSSMGSAH
jgi:hypothetical protein